MESAMSPGLIPTDTPIPVQILNRQNNTRINGCKRKSILYLSVTVIIIGLLCIIFNAVMMLSGERICFICVLSYGYIAGILYCATGVLGCCFFKFRTNKCLSISFMVMNILSASFSVYPLSLGVIEYLSDFPSGRRQVKVTLFGLIIAVLSFIELIIAIVCSAFSCKLLCACCKNEDNTPIYAFYDTKTQQFVLTAGNEPSLPMTLSSPSSAPPDLEDTSIQSNDVIDNESFKYKPFK